MGASNLPPGVSDNMIPGNRPEDEEWDKFLDLLQKKTQDEIEEKELHFPNLPEDWWEDDGVMLMVRHARDIGYEAGFTDGKDEARLSQVEDEDRRHEEKRKQMCEACGGHLPECTGDGTMWPQCQEQK